MCRTSPIFAFDLSAMLTGNRYSELISPSWVRHHRCQEIVELLLLDVDSWTAFQSHSRGIARLFTQQSGSSFKSRIKRKASTVVRDDKVGAHCFGTGHDAVAGNIYWHIVRAHIHHSLHIASS